MNLILNIDTALETAFVSIAKDGVILQQAVNNEQKDHGAFLQTAVQSIAKTTGILLQEIDAVAVVAGPGSYTGLRVGMASAKGLCYALGKPLITIGTMDIMAWQAISEHINIADANMLFCPMIDARRMEVYTAIYNLSFDMVLPATAMIIDEHSFAINLLKNKVLFFGSGAKKWQMISTNANAAFISLEINPVYMSQLSLKKFLNNQFADVAYSEPLYIKEFHSNII